jgi:hypothetical protein
MFARCYPRTMGRKSYVPDIVAPRYALRLEDLGPDHVVHVRCEACLRVVLIEAVELQRARPGTERLVVLAEGLRCMRCSGSPISWSIYRRIDTVGS